MKIPDPLPVERISLKSIFTSILATLNLEKGYFFTLKELLLRPGQAIRGYLFTEERSRYVKPLGFLLLSLAVSILITVNIMEWSGKLDLNTMDNNGQAMTPEMKAALSKILAVVFKYQNLFEILKVPFISFLTYKFFERARFNFAEHLVMNAYALAIQSLLSILIIFLAVITDPILMLAALPLLFVYYIYLHVKTLQEPQLWKGILKSLTAWVVAYLIHSFVLVGILYSYFYWIDPDANVRVLLLPFLE